MDKFYTVAIQLDPVATKERLKWINVFKRKIVEFLKRSIKKSKKGA